MVKPSKNFARQSPVEDGVLRIIGGTWRGRKLHFPALPGLRPSPDRIRETLFNWLAPTLPGAHCLDLFAGSGALGLEALSRDASACTFVEMAPPAARRIGEHLRTLGSASGNVINANVLDWLRHRPAAAATFDVVFVDPPFHQGLLTECCTLLEQNGWLSAGALIYLESGRDEALPPLPQNWHLHRDKQAGQVAYRLLRRGAPALSITP